MVANQLSQADHVTPDLGLSDPTDPCLPSKLSQHHPPLIYPQTIPHRLTQNVGPESPNLTMSPPPPDQRIKTRLLSTAFQTLVQPETALPASLPLPI